MERAWKRNEVAVSPVIATILMVAITVVLAAVLYMMVSAFIIPPEPQNPVEMSKESVGPGVWELRVTSASPEDLTDYKVIILRDGAKVHEMDPLEENTTGDYQFTDLDGGGKLSSGDRFTITCEADSRYELSVIWRSTGSEKGNIRWES